MFDPREAIAVYRGWDALEHERPMPDRAEVIDFDLVTEIDDTERFAARDEVLARVRQLRDSVEVTDETSEFIWAKLNASAHYLRCLLGEQFAFYDHVRAILGVTPELVSEHTIQQQKAAVLECLNGFGVSTFAKEATEFQRLEASLRIGQADAESEARAAEARLFPLVRDLLGFAGISVPHDFEFTEKEAYWVAWAKGTKHSLLVEFNFHPIHQWRKGDLEYLTLHEMCGHLVHAASIAHAIDHDGLNPFIGLTTVHDPSGFICEGIADALTYFFPDDILLSPEAVLCREQRNWRDYLNNNAHVLVNMGWDESLLLTYLCENPFMTHEKANMNLDSWLRKPLWRAYQYAYGIALKYHRTFAATMTPQQKIDYLRYAFTRFVTPTTLIRHAREIMATDKA